MNLSERIRPAIVKVFSYYIFIHLEHNYCKLILVIINSLNLTIMIKYIFPILLLITFSACMKSDIISTDEIHKVWVLKAAFNESGGQLNESEKGFKLIKDSLYLTGIRFDEQDHWMNNYIEGENYHVSAFPATFDKTIYNNKFYKTKENILTLAYAWCGVAIFEYEIEELTENTLILYANSSHQGHDTELRLYYQSVE